MGDIVCDGTQFSCPFCTSKLKLKVAASSTKGNKKKLANRGNSFFPPPGGNCTVIPSAPVPCTPAAVVSDPGQSPVKIDKLQALGAGCKFQCAKGGVISVSSPGQTQAKHNGAKAAGGTVALAAAVAASTKTKKAKKDAYKEAEAGGKHKGQLEQFKKQNQDQLKKSIKSFDKQIAKHKDKMKNPKKYVPDWDKKTPKHQDNLIHHWNEDIKRAKVYKEMATQVLRSKNG